MKLHVAATAWASAAVVLSMASVVPTASAVYSDNAAAAAGTCLSAVVANAGQQQDVDWSEEAAYYAIGNANTNVDYNNYNANDNGEDGDDQEDGEEEQEEQEAEAQQAEYNIQAQMKSLAEALGLGYQDQEDGEEDEQDDNDNQQAFNAEELNYLMAYDEELANALGMEDRDAFAKFYSVLYDLVLSGDGDQCNAGNNNVNYDNNNNNDEEQENNMDEEDNEREEENEDDRDEEQDRDEEDEDRDGEDRRLQEDEENEENEDNEENEGEQIENAVTNIVRNCGSVFYAFGVDLGDIDMDEDNNELQEALHDLSIHIRIEKAIASGAFNFEDGINYNFAANGNEDNGGEGNYDEEFYTLLQSLDIDENELEEDDIMNIKLKLAVKSGALKEHLEANAAFGSVVDDWEGLIQGFFYSLGIQEEIDLENIDSYLAADIYNTAYDLEEYGCQQAMLNQFGKSDAKDYGYIPSKNFTSGETAGIVISVLFFVGLIAAFAFVCGKKKGRNETRGARRSNSKSRPLIDGTAV